MTQYLGPSKERPSYVSKFVRAGERVFVTQPDDLETCHLSLAKEDGVYEEIVALRETNPQAVDGGHVFVEEGGMIFITGGSTSLHIPVRDVFRQARTKTREVFQRQNPDHTVFIDEAP